MTGKIAALQAIVAAIDAKVFNQPAGVSYRIEVLVEDLRELKAAAAALSDGSVAICRDGRAFVIELATVMGVIDVCADPGTSVPIGDVMPQMLARAQEDRQRWHDAGRAALIERLREMADLLDSFYGRTIEFESRNIGIAMREAADALALPPQVSVTEAQTPAARWRDEGQADPHGNRYACDRRELCGGQMTDDELANAVYMDPSNVNLTAAKDRIRWLSRQLSSPSANLSVTEAMVEASCQVYLARTHLLTWNAGTNYRNVIREMLQAALSAAPAPTLSDPPRHSDQYTPEDMEEVGRRLIDTLHDNRNSLKGWFQADCPTEIVCDLINARDEALAELATARAAAVPAGGDEVAWTCERCGFEAENSRVKMAHQAGHNNEAGFAVPPSEPSDGELREILAAQYERMNGVGPRSAGIRAGEDRTLDAHVAIAAMREATRPARTP